MTKDSEATPKPDSPVCVEAWELEWEHHPENEEYNEMWFADLPSGPATIIRDEGKFHIFVAGHKFKPKSDLPSAQSACQAVMASLVAELVNARSVESVKAERDRELIEVFAAKSQEIDQSDENGRALALSYINAVQCLRALTEGEG